MAIIPRTECAYISLSRAYTGRRRPNRGQYSNYSQGQQSLRGIQQRAHDLDSDYMQDKQQAFIRDRERSSNQVKDPHVIPFNLRLKKFAKARNWKAALECIKEIHQRGLRPDEISYATAIDACSKSFKSREAIKLFQEMQYLGIRPNVPIYNAVMNACARDHQWKQTLGFLNDMRNNGIIPNIVSYNVCLSALEKSKKWSIAVELMKDIRTSGITMQAITYNTVISACAKSRKMNVCEELHQQMIVDGFKPDRFTYSSLLNGYRKVRNWHAMFRIADDMKNNGVQFDAVIYSTVIGACADAEECTRAFQFFEEMKVNGIKPNEIVYSCLLRACNNVQLVDKLLHDMTIDGIEKNSVVFTSAINVAHKYGDISDATRWFDQMTSEGIKPDWVAYMSLFEVLNKSKNNELLDKYYEQGLASGVLSHFAKNNNMSSESTMLDFHGWSTALAKAALRHVLKQCKASFERGFPVRRLSILTGKGYSKSNPVLRPAITRMLQSEFSPSLSFSVNNGVINVDQSAIMHWIRRQHEAPPRHRSLVNERKVTKEDEARAQALLFPDRLDLPPFQSPPFLCRFETDDPLYWSHCLLGRDNSPPVSYVNLPKEKTPPFAVIPGLDHYAKQMSL
jgi:pentatricopeptide repeat protein